MTEGQDAKSRDGIIRKKARRSHAELYKARETLRALLAAGVSMDKVAAKMEPYGVKGGTLKRMIRDVVQTWESEAIERQPYARAAHLHRIQTSIFKAQDAGAWNAVATLERVAMEVGGTASPPPEPPPVAGVQQHAILVLLGDMPPDRLAQLIDRERKLLTDGKVIFPNDSTNQPIAIESAKTQTAAVEAVVQEPDVVAGRSVDDSGRGGLGKRRTGDVADRDTGGSGGARSVVADANGTAIGEVEYEDENED